VSWKPHQHRSMRENRSGCSGRWAVAYQVTGEAPVPRESQYHSDILNVARAVEKSIAVARRSDFVCSPVKTIKRRRPSHLLLYYITDRSQFSGDPAEQERRLLEKISECAAAEVDYIQLREKDLVGHALEKLARRARAAISAGSSTRLLINSRTDVALAAGAHGVHLPAGDLYPSEVRAIMMRAGVREPVIGFSAHSLDEVALAESHGADFAVFAPVFEKNGQPSLDGLNRLRQACNREHAADPPMPILALGGITLENAQQCVTAGAAGIAGIRLFQHNAVEPLRSRLRTAFAP
jgi:thiamine-phosphate pyrophosphorylase